jgi:hypothetical protein
VRRRVGHDEGLEVGDFHGSSFPVQAAPPPGCRGAVVLFHNSGLLRRGDGGLVGKKDKDIPQFSSKPLK